MSNELQAQLSTGNTLYAILFNSVGQVWNGCLFLRGLCGRYNNK